MRIGFHTNAFVWAGVSDLREIAAYAEAQGFSCLEVGPGVPLDRPVFAEVGRRMPIAAMIYCRNFIDDDPETQQRERAELWRRMEFASSLGVGKMICSTGISRELSLPESGGCDPLGSLDRALEFLNAAAARARELGVTLCLENCPMYRNIATSPYMWRRIFREIDDPALGLCYDASHFVWQFIDVYSPMREFAGRIHHLHLKDTVLYREKLGEVGILHNTARERGFEENQWWRHTVIGEGEINWRRFLDLAGTLPSPLLDMSFEMEDCRFEGQKEKVEAGLTLQMRRLKTYLYENEYFKADNALR